MKKRIIFIINPISGDIKKANLPKQIESYLDLHQFSFEIMYSERAGHASIIAAKAVADQVDFVVAVGGDGSINEIAKELVNTPVSLAIIPLGSGNALAYHLALPVKKIQQAIEVINKGKIIKIDTLKSNKGEVVSFAGIGLEAVAARTYRHLGKRGFLAYAWATILSIFFKYKAQNVRFKIDGVAMEKEVYLFTVYNARYLGYKVAKIKGVSLVDGKMHVVIIKTFKMWKLLWIAILELLGKIHLAKETEILEASKLEITLPKKAHLQLDGDSFITSSDFKLAINPLSLNIIVPQHLENY